MNEVVSTKARPWIIGLILLFGTAMRLAGIGSEALWYDELFSATQASVSVSEVPATVRTHDMHPPLYYLQLSAWQKASSSDVWLRMNSVLWWLLGGVSLYYVVGRVASSPVAILTIVFYVLNPTGVHFAQELRMYSLLTFLAVWCFHFSERLFEGGKGFNGRLLLATTVAVVYSHGAGFLILVCLWSHAAWAMMKRRISLPTAGSFLAVQLFAMLMGLPEHLRAASLHLNFGGLTYAIAPSASELVRQSSWLYAGNHAGFGSFTTAVTLILTLGPLAVACARSSPAQRAMVFYVFVPIAACCAISHLSRPIWIFRAISFTVPFCCFTLAFGVIKLGGALSRLGIRLAPKSELRLKIGYASVLALFFAYSVYCQREIYPRPSQFKEIADYVRQDSAEHDVVFVPQIFSYWSFCWYFVEPGAVHPLSEAYVLRSQTGQTVAWMCPTDGRAAELVTTGSRNPYILIRGRPQADAILAKIEAEQNWTSQLVAKAGKVGLWALCPPQE